jgi:hypothetical protein
MNSVAITFVLKLSSVASFPKSFESTPQEGNPIFWMLPTNAKLTLILDIAKTNFRMFESGKKQSGKKQSSDIS